MNRKGETIPLSLMYFGGAVILYRYVPAFAAIYRDLYGTTDYQLPLPTRVITAIPSAAWLVLGVLMAGAILLLNQRRNSFWINVTFVTALFVVAALCVVALFTPLIVDIIKLT